MNQIDINRFLSDAVINEIKLKEKLDYDPFSVTNIKKQFNNMETQMAEAIQTASYRQLKRNQIKKELLYIQNGSIQH